MTTPDLRDTLQDMYRLQAIATVQNAKYGDCSEEIDARAVTLNLLEAARNLVVAFCEAPLPSIAASYACAVMDCDEPARMVYRDKVGRAIGFYGACAYHLRILDQEGGTPNEYTHRILPTHADSYRTVRRLRT